MVPILSESSNTIIQKFKDSLPNHRIDESTAKRLLALSLVSCFGGLLQAITSDQAAWIKVMDDPEPEKVFIMGCKI